VPGGSRAGDQVCIVRGGQSPLLIRPLSQDGIMDSKYELVGTCYIHEIMKGKGLESGAEGKKLGLV